MKKNRHTDIPTHPLRPELKSEASRLTSRGFTLVELLISMGLLSGLILILTNIFVATLQVQLRSQTISALQQDSGYLLQRLQYDVYRSSDVTTPSSIGAVSNSLSLDIDGETWTYSVVNGVMSLSDGISQFPVHSNRIQVDAFSAQKVGNVGGGDGVQVSFSISSRVNSGTQDNTKTFITTLGTR